MATNTHTDYLPDIYKRTRGGPSMSNLGPHLFNELSKYISSANIAGLTWEAAYDVDTQDTLVSIKYYGTDRGAGARIKHTEAKTLAQIAKEVVSEEFVAMLLISKPQPPAAQMEAKV